MKIEKILAGIRESQSEKTASEKPAAATSEKTAAPREALVSALNEALATTSDKTASAETNPVADVMKVASEVAGSEKEAAFKEAQLLGSAFADAAVARFAEWNKVASSVPAPAPVVVAAGTTASADFGKFSSENPELVKQAHQLGYEQAKKELEKQAEDYYAKGFNDTVTQIHKTAAQEFYKGAVITSRVLDAVSAR